MSKPIIIYSVSNDRGEVTKFFISQSQASKFAAACIHHGLHIVAMPQVWCDDYEEALAKFARAGQVEVAPG